MLNSSNNDKTQKEYRIPVEKLYPDLSPEEHKEVEYFLTRYLEVIYRIFQENHGKIKN